MRSSPNLAPRPLELQRSRDESGAELGYSPGVPVSASGSVRASLRQCSRLATKVRILTPLRRAQDRLPAVTVCNPRRGLCMAVQRYQAPPDRHNRNHCAWTERWLRARNMGSAAAHCCCDPRLRSDRCEMAVRFPATRPFELRETGTPRSKSLVSRTLVAVVERAGPRSPGLLPAHTQYVTVTSPAPTDIEPP
jgi:hypothetical protein